MVILCDGLLLCSQVPIFIQFNGFPPHIDASFHGRVRLVEGASIELRDIETTDEGWYECSIVFLDGTNEHNDANGTWLYLSVNGNYSQYTCVK